jgi:hypothetical protein
VQWKRTGGEPFSDVDFLLKSVKQLNQKPANLAAASATP